MATSPRASHASELPLFEAASMARRRSPLARAGRAFTAWLDSAPSRPEPPSAADRPAGVSALRYWSPVWVPLLLLAQGSLRGLGPSLAESARLTHAEERMLARYEGAVAKKRELGRLLRAQADPIYLERERRQLRMPSSPLLRR